MMFWNFLQTCTLKFGSWTSHGEQIDLKLYRNFTEVRKDKNHIFYLIWFEFIFDLVLCDFVINPEGKHVNSNSLKYLYLNLDKGLTTQIWWRAKFFSSNLQRQTLIYFYSFKWCYLYTNKLNRQQFVRWG